LSAVHLVRMPIGRSLFEIGSIPAPGARFIQY
jgi:hypothetical protein